MDRVTGAMCAEHVGVPALAACDRCGVFVCGACGSPHDYRILCRRCLERVTYILPHTPRSVVAVVFGVLSILGVLPLGIFAVVLGMAELRDIRQGTRPAGGRWFAQAAVLFGWMAVGLLALTVMAIVLVFAFDLL